jgi:transcriptional regulator with XRE-family HTH domain
MPLGLIFDVPNVYHEPNRFASQMFTGVLMPITVEQLRAARALLGWSQRELAAKSRVSRNAIVKFEIGWSLMLPRTMEDLVEAFEEAGVIFIEEDDSAGPGVRLKKGVRPALSKQAADEDEEAASSSGVKAAWDFEGEEDVDLDALLSEEPGLNPDMAEMWRDDPELWARLSQGGRETLSRRMYGDTRAVSEEYFRHGV